MQLPERRHCNETGSVLRPVQSRANSRFRVLRRANEITGMDSAPATVVLQGVTLMVLGVNREIQQRS